MTKNNNGNGKRFCFYRQDKIKEYDRATFVVAKLIEEAIWAVGVVIDMVTDILSWINGKLEELLEDGVTEVDTVQGQALAEFIKQNQQTGKYTEVSLEQLNAMNNSVINIALNDQGEVIDVQMIRSNGGISSSTAAQFKGQPVLKIKLKD